MIDASDIGTLDLPGIPSVPPKTSQDMRREAMGFQGPRQRAGCQHCAHLTFDLLDTGSNFEAKRIRCGKGDFPVQRGAFCNDYKAGRRP